MSGPYTVTITPGLLAEGEHKGQLEYLHFTAIAGDEMQRWWVVNTGYKLYEWLQLLGRCQQNILSDII